MPSSPRNAQRVRSSGSRTQSAESPDRPLSAFLLGRGAPPPSETLRAAALGAYTYAVLPPEHPQRQELRDDFLASLARHHRILIELVPLLAAWREAGIDALLFKGFWLAEFAYPAPGLRFHGDVDVLLRPGQVAAAAEIGRTLGWREVVHPIEGRRPYSHEAFVLVRPGGATRIDAHRFILHSRIRWNATQRRITEAVWARARERAWEGITIFEPDPVDALLVGLILQRCWGDRWRLKSSDALDFRLLVERHGIRRTALWTRARELRCTRTLRIFLERCDPETGRLDLAPPSRLTALRSTFAVFRERPTLAFETRVARLPRAPAALLDAVRALPTVLRVWLALRRYRPLADLLASLTPARPRTRRTDPVRRARTVRGVRWAVWLLRIRPHGACLVRSLALYRALRHQGWPVVFVSGVRRSAGAIGGHAWVELDDEVLPELVEPMNRMYYAENFRYPR